MKVMTPLRVFFILGNALLLFRNLSFTSRINRCIIYCAILVELFCTIGYSVLCLYFNVYFGIADVIFINVGLLNSILFVLLSCYHGENFKKLLEFLESNYGFVDKDNMYLKDFGRKKNIFKLALVTYLTVRTIVFYLSSRYFISDKTLSYFVVVILKINAFLWDFRYFYEYLLMYALLYMFSEHLECIIRSVVEQKRLVAAELKLTGMTVPNDSICSQYVEKISEWFEAFKHVKEAAKLFNTIFSFQLAVMLTSAVFYVTFFLYDTSVLGIKDGYNSMKIIKYIVRLVIFHVHIIVLSRAGQRLHNNVEHLKRRIGKILISSLIDEKFYKATKDLLDYICYGQTRIQAFGSIDVDMSLPPTFIMLFTSYTILALQLNNVL
nr:gustatory receptor 36 [Papilio glaucus]